MTKAVVKEVWANRLRNQAGTREFAQCTAWVNFNGTGTVAIRDSLNVSSITDNGAGDYTVNFAQTMDNTGYCLVGSINRESVGGARQVSALCSESAVGFSLSNNRIFTTEGSTTTANGRIADKVNICASYFGGITL